MFRPYPRRAKPLRGQTANEYGHREANAGKATAAEHDLPVHLLGQARYAYLGGEPRKYHDADRLPTRMRFVPNTISMTPTPVPKWTLLGIRTEGFLRPTSAAMSRWHSEVR